VPDLEHSGLDARDITVRYGGAVANNAVSIVARPGEITGLIGPNGAGKTSFVDAIAGFTPCTGEVTVAGESLTRLAPHRRAQRGLVRTWQAGELFDDITVVQNLEVALNGFGVASPWKDIASRRPRNANVHRIAEVMEQLGLDHVRDRRPHELSLGERRLVGVARAMVMSPKVLLLDEPAAGLDPQESRQLGTTIASIADAGVAVLLIEHDIDLVLGISHRIFVLDYGRLIADGTPSQIRADRAVLAAYLGETDDRKSSEAAS